MTSRRNTTRQEREALGLSLPSEFRARFGHRRIKRQPRVTPTEAFAPLQMTVADRMFEQALRAHRITGAPFSSVAADVVAALPEVDAGELRRLRQRAARQGVVKRTELAAHDDANLLKLAKCRHDALNAKIRFRSGELRPAPKDVTAAVEIIPSSELKRPICRFPERAAQLVEQLFNRS